MQREANQKVSIMKSSGIGFGGSLVTRCGKLPTKVWPAFYVLPSYHGFQGQTEQY
jgi:hypothetical protein